MQNIIKKIITQICESDTLLGLLDNALYEYSRKSHAEHLSLREAGRLIGCHHLTVKKYAESTNLIVKIRGLTKIHTNSIEKLKEVINKKGN